LIELDKQFRLPKRLIRTRINFEVFVQILLTRYLKNSTRIQTLGRYSEIYCKFTGSPTWRAVCHQILGQYLGQYSFTPASQIHFLIERLNITPQSHVLDLASGLGGLSCYLARVSGCHVIGVDASQMGVKIGNREAASQGLAERVSFEVGFLPDLSYKDCRFDAVISVDSVYAVPDKSQLFRGCYRVLKPGGYIGFYTLYKRRKILCKTPMHTRVLRWMPLKPYSVYLKKVGFMDMQMVDLTEELIHLLSRWIGEIEKNKGSLINELGTETVDGILKEFKSTWVLADEGLIGRALYKAQKPLNGL